MFTLDLFLEIISNGFENTLSGKTMDIITDLTSKVASPTYIRTPVFQPETCGVGGGDDNYNRKRRCGGGGRRHGNSQNYSDKLLNNEPFKKTEIIKKEGIRGRIDEVRSYLNRISEKSYENMKQQILDILKDDNNSEEDMTAFSHAIFEIASTNRFYSQLYANLYSELIDNHEIIRDIFNINLILFSTMFDNIEYVESADDYELFCKINKVNERRKALGSFLLNLTRIGVLNKNTFIAITSKLLRMLLQLIKLEGKQNEVNEITENIAILYDPIVFSGSTEHFDGATIIVVFKHLATSKLKNYPSLSNKANFKFMDIVGM